MRQRIYLKIGKISGKRTKVSAHIKPNFTPFDNGSYNKTYFPTIIIAVDLDIPDSEFDATRILLKNFVEHSTPAVEIKNVKSNANNESKN